MRIDFRKLVFLWIFPLVLALAASATQSDHTQADDIDTVTPRVVPPPSYWISMLPEGEGKELVAKNCTSSCHTLQRAIAFSRPRQQWEDVVGAMVGRGAKITPEEFPVVVNYLAENFGPTTKPRGLTALQPCKPSEWPKGSADFRKPWGNTYTVWASNQQGGTVDIINPALNKVVRKISCISAADRIEFSPDGNTAYIPDRVEWNVTVLDTRTGAIIKKIPLVARPNTAVITRDGKKLYVAIWPVAPEEATVGHVEVIDLTKLEVAKIIDTPSGTHDTWMSKGGEMWLAMSGSAALKARNFMNAYDTKTDKLLWTCCTTSDEKIGTMDMELGPNGATSRIFVGFPYPGITVLDPKTGKELFRVPYPTDTEGPFAGIDPRGSFHNSEISGDGKSIWFDNGKTIYHYSLPELKHLGHVHLADLDQMGNVQKEWQGSWLTVSPDGQKVYCARPSGDLVDVIDVPSMKEVARIPVDEYPLHVSIWPRGTP